MGQVEWVREGSTYEIVEAEDPQILSRNLASAAHLLASAAAMFFLAFVFAYFYLRSLNSNDLWRPRGVDPSLTVGTLATAAWVLGAAVLWLGLRDLRAGRRSQWRVKGVVALALGIVGIALQIAAWFTVGFGPTEGGYASVYFGWTGFLVLFGLGAAYWLETTLATSFRYRQTSSPEPGEASGDARAAHDIEDPLSLVSPSLDAVSFFWIYFAVLIVVAWVVLYLL
jgi:heme/copper-type cytochrome/quinol oxidase subunit 3